MREKGPPLVHLYVGPSASVLLSLETRDGFYYQSLLNADQPEFLIPAEPTTLEVMREYSWLGAEHIWGGIDHLLFVFGLVFELGYFNL